MTGGAAVLTAAVGVGAIVGSAFYVKNIGDRFYNSTQLMNAYLDGDKEAGEKLVENAQIHFVFVATGTQFSDALSGLTSSVFAETHLGEKIGSFFAEAFERTSIGCDGALEILNKISPKYADMLKSLINKYGYDAAELIVEDYENKGIQKVESNLDNLEGGIKTKQTLPTLSKGSEPKGEFSPENSSGLIGQNNAAKKLAYEGYDIEMLPEALEGNGYGIKNTANPDYLINENAFDCYTPETSTSANSICKKIRQKTIDQADRIVLNLENTSTENIDIIKESILRKTDINGDLKRLKELIVILPDDGIECWFLR